MKRFLLGVVMFLTACGAPEQPVSYQRPSDSSVSPTVSSGIAGLPPEPTEETRKTYIQTLNGIDPDIVHGKEYTAVERGRNQCASVKAFPNDEAKWVQLTLQRFTSPNHPDGFGVVKASKILVAVRKYLCPTY